MMATGWIPLLLATAFGLQPPGMFHGDEPVARTGERWLALEATGDGLRLTPTRVRLDRVVDEMVDEPGEATGLQVVAVDVPDAVVLLRGPALRAGPVEAGRVIPDDHLAQDASAAFHFRGVLYHLQPRCPAVLPAADESQTCHMLLTRGDTAQALYEVKRWRDGGGQVIFGDQPHPQLMHIGDFDHDGKPDLIIDTADHYNTSQPTLFLSSPAARAKMLEQVALHHSVGC